MEKGEGVRFCSNCAPVNDSSVPSEEQNKKNTPKLERIYRPLQTEIRLFGGELGIRSKEKKKGGQRYFDEFVQLQPKPGSKERTRNTHKKKKESQKKKTLCVTFHLGKKNAGKEVLFWAAKPEKNYGSSLTKGGGYLYAKDAYGKHFPNSGTSKTDNSGTVTVTLQPPQPYRSPSTGRVYPRHVHLITEADEKKSWSTKGPIYTKAVVPDITFEEAERLFLLRRQEKSRFVVFVDTRSPKAYNRLHIPGAVHFSHLQEEREDEKRKKIYVVYCNNAQCSLSASTAANMLLQGFVNVLRYKGGMQNWCMCSNLK